MILYQGPSLLDPEVEIVVIVTGLMRPTANKKTGPIPQVWILLANVEPLEALKTGEDFAICGGCIFAGDCGCYVNVGRAPRAIYRAFKAGKYEAYHPERLTGLMWLFTAYRFGSYGDPAAAPAWASQLLIGNARPTSKPIGYTEKWRDCDPAFAGFLMASVKSHAERAEAKALGWRTYRATADLADMLDGELLCPASKESPAIANCATCRLCDGMNSPAKPDVVELIHGRNHVRTKAIAALSALS